MNIKYNIKTETLNLIKDLTPGIDTLIEETAKEYY